MKARYLVQCLYPVAAPLDGTDSVRDRIIETGYVVVVDGPEFIGILTSKDIIRSPRNLILDCIRERPSVDFEQDVDSILNQMSDGGFDTLPVFKDGVFKGVVLQSDILAFLSDYNQELEKKIRQHTRELLEINEKLKKEIQDREIAEKQNRELSERMHHSEKVAAIGNLAAGIAHDFNNILSPIIGFSELAMADAARGSDLWHHLDEIHGAGNRAKELIKQILRYARQGRGTVAPISIKSVLDEGLKLIQSSLPASIAIEQRVETDAFVKADPTMIHQIYMNLCTNAYHAMDENGGRLRISARTLFFLHDSEFTPKGILPGEYVELAVADTGIGILPEHLNRVFDPYFTTKAVGKGTGLGLSTVFGIVKGYGGGIHIESLPGQGTTVLVYLPVTSEEPVTPSDLEAPLREGHEAILFVDDEEAITRMNQQYLERAGYRVAVQTDPLQALTLFKSTPDAFDLVVTDMTMPQMSGDVLTHELKRIRPDIPVILCTGYNHLLSEERTREIGLAAVLNKPVSFSELARSIRAALDGNHCPLNTGDPVL